MALKSYLEDTFSEHKSSLMQTSFDSKNEKFLCQDKQTSPVYDFDDYVKINNVSPLPASPDAIYLGDKKFYFVEFKNSPLANIKIDNIQNKFRSGTRILADLLQEHIPQDDFKFLFCVVYQSPEVKYFNPMHIESNIIRFGLEEINEEHGNFYNKIITNDVEFYKKNFTILKCI